MSHEGLTCLGENSMNLPTTALILVLLLLAWLFIRRRQGADDAPARRFLSSAAPKLPLPDCEVLDCSCRFVHHKDRRTGKDRRSPFGPSGFGGGTGNYEAEQRQGRDRRASEEDEEFF
jgi:hypothetical protein